MVAKSRRSRKSDLETTIAPDELPDDLRRNDPPAMPPDSMPPRETGGNASRPAGGGFSPAEDGGVDQHPIHDEDQEDMTSSDYEREIDRLDAAARRKE